MRLEVKNEQADELVTELVSMSTTIDISEVYDFDDDYSVLYVVTRMEWDEFKLWLFNSKYDASLEA